MGLPRDINGEEFREGVIYSDGLNFAYLKRERGVDGREELNFYATRGVSIQTCNNLLLPQYANVTTTEWEAFDRVETGFADVSLFAERFSNLAAFLIRAQREITGDFREKASKT